MSASVATAFAPRRAEAASQNVEWLAEVAPSLAAAQPVWDELTEGSEPSPYQRFGWVSAFAGTDGGQARIVVIREANGAAAALLPVCVGNRFGLRVGRGIGGKHANLYMPVLRAGLLSALSPGRAEALLRAAGRALVIDALILSDIPASWAGQPNPFAQLGAPGRSTIHTLDLLASGEATLKRSMSADARKKLRSKERSLAKLGPVVFLQARERAEAALLLDAFFAQKHERFLRLGIKDPFACPNVQGFVRRASLDSPESGRPAIELYGLLFEGRPIAIFGGAASRERLSGMFISFEQGELARYSPGDLLLTHVVGRQCELARRVFDLGVGEARYKRSICDGTENLFEIALPFTLPGRAYVAASDAASSAKRRIKAHPGAMAAIARLRKSAAALRG